MERYKVYKLKNADSIIGFPLIALCETNSSYIDYTDSIISISPDFSSQHPKDIDLYLEDYSPTEFLFEFDYKKLLADLNLLSERQVSLTYHSLKPLLDITHHWLGEIPAYEETLYEIPKQAKERLDRLIAIFASFN